MSDQNPNGAAPRAITIPERDAEVMLEKTGVNLGMWTMMSQLAEKCIASGAFPSALKNSAQALVVMQAGIEIGLKPMQAVQSMFFINGRLSMYSSSLLALMQRNGLTVEWKTLSAEKVEGVFSCKNRPSVTISFTKEDAARAGLNGPNYTKYPQDMFVARCVSRAAKLFPDLVGYQNIETREVMDDVIDAADNNSSKVEEARVLPSPKDIGKPAPAPLPDGGSEDFKTVIDYLDNAASQQEVAEIIKNLITNKSWTSDEAKKINAHVAYTVKRIKDGAVTTKAQEPKQDAVDTAQAAKEVFGTGEVTRESREEMLEDMKSEELNPLVTKIDPSLSPSRMKKREKIDVILAGEFPPENQTAIPMAEKEVSAQAPAPEKKNSVLEDLFSAGQ